jgi:glycosyltransferase involved in cell wall biosynthesis
MPGEKKKILFILQLPPPLHGASVMNRNLINSEVIKDNYYVNFINLQFAKSIRKLAKFSFWKILKSFYYGLKILKRILTYKPDLVYFTLSPVGYAFYRDAFYVFLLKILNKKIVLHLHGKGINKNASRSKLNKNLYEWVFKNTHVICLSKSLLDDISGVYFSSPFIVPNGIEVQSFVNKKATHPLNESIPHILFLSNFIRNKGVLILIEALSILKSQGYNFNARFVGESSDLTIEMLEDIVRNKNLSEFVKIVGPLYSEDKVVEFQKADILVFPTYNDAFPLVIIEGMQNSLPVISTREGGIPEIIIDKETGFLVEAQNTEMLANKIAILLKDKNLRVTMGEKGYERFINYFTLNHFENNINKTLREILGIH